MKLPTSEVEGCPKVDLGSEPNPLSSQEIDALIKELTAPRQLDEQARQEALLSIFGAWAEDAEDLDRFMELTRQQRKVSRREIDD